MRTTIRMHDNLLVEAKAAAASSGQTLTAFIEDAVRHQLDARKTDLVATAVTLPSFSGDGVFPGVDLDNAAALLDLLELDRTLDG